MLPFTLGFKRDSGHGIVEKFVRSRPLPFLRIALHVVFHNRRSSETAATLVFLALPKELPPVGCAETVATGLLRLLCLHNASVDDGQSLWFAPRWGVANDSGVCLIVVA